MVFNTNTAGAYLGSPWAPEYGCWVAGASVYPPGRVDPLVGGVRSSIRPSREIITLIVLHLVEACRLKGLGMSEGQGRDVQAKDSDGLDSAAAAAFGSHGGAAVEALEAVDLEREYGTVTLAEARELFPWMLEELATISPSCPGVVCPQTYTVWQVRDIPTPRAASGHTCDAVGAYLFELDSACCHRRVRFLEHS